MVTILEKGTSVIEKGYEKGLDNGDRK